MKFTLTRAQLFLQDEMQAGLPQSNVLHGKISWITVFFVKRKGKVLLKSSHT
jgi:hypothetical protein